ncbi:MAG: EamA family transporter [Nanohaloarchaea archaeon]|nr:EamA family transporter [Candidatus Nanohaloarchaea archaeon]
METWFIFGILSYLSYAISTSIDKYMMNEKYNTIKTNTLKMFFDGIILLIASSIFFNISITNNLIFGSLILGSIYAFSGIFYFETLNLKDVSSIVPYYSSASLLFIFFGSIIFFNEIVNIFNYIGIAAIMIGIYLVLSETGLRLPKKDKGLTYATIVIIFSVSYSLLTKLFLNDIEPMALAICMYFSATLFLILYLHIFKKENLKQITHYKRYKKQIKNIFIASFFGASGTFLLYYALSVGNASKVYPLVGLQMIFIFMIATIMLKEKFRLHKFIGTLIVFIGIFLISI